MNYRFIPSIKEQIEKGTFVAAKLDERKKFGRSKRTKGNNVVPGKGFPKRLDPLANIQTKSLQKNVKSPILSFDTTNNTATPSDPTGAVGRDFYIASWNLAFRIFNKDGTPAMPAAGLETLFPGGADGDPIVLYDAQADRYIVTEFEDNPDGFHVAVSETNDPINDGWHIYSADSFQTAAFPDYTKFSIWSDAYYVTANITGSDDLVWAIERDKMLVGDPTAGIQAFPLPGIATNTFYSPQAFNVTDGNLPARGNATIVFMQDDAWFGVDNDHLKLWTINVDWEDESNSTISPATEIATTPFIATFDGGSFSNLSQPSGPDIDAMQATIMNQAQFRKFDTHNSVVFNFVVDTDAQNELAGVRWYELRQNGDGQPWSIYQEGTYTAPEGRHAFGASMAMDGEGNIGMGYSSLSDTESISLRYTGRFNDDPLNTMTALEELIVQSTSDSPSDRYADYSHLTVDPSNDADFWFVSEYFNNGLRSNRVGVFQITEPLTNDIGISSISAPSDGVLSTSEAITITIRNFGTNTQSNFPVSYTINGGTEVTETFTGSLTQGQTLSYTFATTADLSITNQSYTIEASSNLTTDENLLNNTTTTEVLNALNFCIPVANDCSVDGIKRFILGDIIAGDGSNGCNSTGTAIGYVDRRELSTNLDRSINEPHVVQAQHNFTSGPDLESFSLWIDFDDSGTFDSDEHLIQGAIFSVANQLESFRFTIPETAQLGSHVLRAKAIDFTAVGDINDPCTNFTFGEVHDYTVNIIDTATLTTNDFIVDTSDFKVLTLSNNQYEFILRTEHEGLLSFRVYDLSGKLVVFNNISKEGDVFRYSLDMSHASSGLYVVRMGSITNYKSYKKIVN